MADIKFEDAMKKLEKIVTDLEDGELSLEEALKRYEDGIKLSKVCTKKLDEAKKKIEILIKNDNGEITLENFDEAGTKKDPKKTKATKKPAKKTKNDEEFLF